MVWKKHEAGNEQKKKITEGGEEAWVSSLLWSKTK